MHAIHILIATFYIFIHCASRRRDRANGVKETLYIPAWDSHSNNTDIIAKERSKG